jgi:ABC-type amino acid transport substrate-binding protein
MSLGSSAALAVALLIFAARSAAPVSGEEPLRVCLEANAPPWSMHDGTRSGGFDLAVAGEIARRVDRSLAVQWFKSELDRDSSTTLAANALLSDRLCQLVGGYPLVESALTRPGTPFARLPDYEGARPSDRRRSVELGMLVPSRAYHFAALTIVLGATGTSARITELSQLDGMKLGVEGATLADATLTLFDDGRFINQTTHVIPGRDELLERLENGEYDAALVELRRFDAYRAKYPETKLTASGYYSPIGFNMGFVGLSTNQDLIEKIDRSIARMLDNGELTALARDAGVTYLPPHEPNVSRDITITDLRRN